ncbi:MAG: hypothetical protein LBC95_01105 [Candidatus Nomurabacteria bacterium]|jgi:hypothetical protein|nr:hypothetical protein [Candidatus Nomurabacteria bacterium]
MRHNFEVEPGANPKPKELQAASYLAKHGFKVILLKPVNKPGAKNPDAKINGVVFEIKTPTSNRPRTTIKRFQEAMGQSKCVIFDLRKVKGSVENMEKLLLKLAGDLKCQRLIIITKQNKTIDTADQI